MLAVTVSQVVALLSSALSTGAAEEEGGGGGSGLEIVAAKKKAAAADGGERCWRRCAAGSYCCVCISACRDGEEIRWLPCGHAFHRDCVDRWLARCRRTCPLCRLHVGGGAAVGLVDEEQHHQLSEDLVIWFSSLFVASL
jgi:hypothetical protein